MIVKVIEVVWNTEENLAPNLRECLVSREEKEAAAR